MRRVHWVGVAAAFVVATVVAGGLDVAIAQANAIDGRITVARHAANGIEIGHDPTVRPGRSLDIVAAGFAPSAAVDARIACRSSPVGTFTADARGAVRFRFTVPADLAAGRHVLSLSGAVRPTARETAQPSGNLAVTVPLVEYYRFSVAGPSAVVTGC